MKILLDTHTLYWFIEGDPQLSGLVTTIPGPLLSVIQGSSPGRVSPNEVARDDVAVGAVADDIDPIETAAGDDVPLAGVIDAKAIGSDSIAGGASDDNHSASDVDLGVVINRLIAVLQGDIPADARTDEVVRDGVAIGVLPRDPDAREQ